MTKAKKPTRAQLEVQLCEAHQTIAALCGVVNEQDPDLTVWLEYDCGELSLASVADTGPRFTGLGAIVALRGAILENRGANE